MNSLPSREDAGNRAGLKSCCYCNKTFDNYRALGGHLRIHQQNRSSRTRNSRCHLANSFEISRNPSLSGPNSQGQHSSGVDGDHLVHPTSCARSMSPSGFPRVFCGNEVKQGDTNNFTGNNHGLARPLSITSPNYSYRSRADVTYQSSCLSSTVSSPAGGPAAISPSSFALSGGTIASVFSLDLFQHTGSYPVCQFNTDKGLYDPGSFLSGVSKRSYLGEGSLTGGTNPLKKLKNISGLAVESEECGKKALDAELVGQVDLDLSLHL